MRMLHLPALGLWTCLAALLMGCGGKKDGAPTTTPAPAAAAKGVLILAEPNDKFHIRLTITKESKTALAEILDEKVATPVGIEEESITLVIKDAKPVQIQLKAEGKGKKTSRFEVVHDRLGEDVDAGKIEVTATISGKEFHFTKDDHKH